MWLIVVVIVALPLDTFIPGGMCLLMHFLQPAQAHVGVDLSRVELGMTQVDLQGSQVRTVFHHQRRRCVAQDVTGTGFLNARLPHAPLDDHGQRFA